MSETRKLDPRIVRAVARYLWPDYSAVPPRNQALLTERAEWLISHDDNSAATLYRIMAELVAECAPAPEDRHYEGVEARYADA